jgi:NOL1/NOP2/fmu family ribosome biogenesis protein
MANLASDQFSAVNVKRLALCAVRIANAGSIGKQRMARPRKGNEMGATMQIGVRISAELRAALEKSASRHSRSLSEEARFALEKYVAIAPSARGREAKIKRPRT